MCVIQGRPAGGNLFPRHHRKAQKLSFSNVCTRSLTQSPLSMQINTAHKAPSMGGGWIYSFLPWWQEGEGRYGHFRVAPTPNIICQTVIFDEHKRLRHHTCPLSGAATAGYLLFRVSSAPYDRVRKLKQDTRSASRTEAIIKAGPAPGMTPEIWLPPRQDLHSVVSTNSARLFKSPLGSYHWPCARNGKQEGVSRPRQWR